MKKQDTRTPETTPTGGGAHSGTKASVSTKASAPKKTKAGPTLKKVPLPRWLAPRPIYAPASFVASMSSSGGSTGVTVTMAGRDLGIDNQGYRQESQKAPTPADNRFSWIHAAPQAGLTLPHDTTDDAGNPIPENQPWPNYWTMVVRVTPADRVDQIGFEKHGEEPWCVDYVVAAIDATKGEIRVRVTAKVPTTAIKKNGKKVRRKTGALIVAKYKGVRVAQANFYVIRPEFLNRKPRVIVPGTLTAPSLLTVHAEYEGPAVDPGLRQQVAPPEKRYEDHTYVRFIEVDVRDQYWQPLANFYAGTTVSEDGTWIAWSKGATYLDPVWMAYGFVRTWTDANGHQWDDFTGLAPGFPLPWINNQAGDFVVRVAGWVLNNGDLMNRRLTISDVTPPSPPWPNPMPPFLHYRLEYY